jgi:hypothetical protein
MLLFPLTIFTSAFLLFLVQPVIAKQILPWFGGSAAVWTTCLVFFQTTLLLGYAYADLVVRHLSRNTQAKLHVAFLVASLAVLPIVPAEFWKPAGNENPVLRILGLLTATIGLPYFLLSATSPLVQAWFARRYPGRNPYRLFALSNLASMLALIGYPFLLEPWVATTTQAIAWSGAYILFALLCGLVAWRSRKSRIKKRRHRKVRDAEAPAEGADDTASSEAAAAVAAVAAVTVAPEDPAPTLRRQVLWCTLPAVSSILLLATTNHITQNIAAVPLLWLVPLTLYLITFIVCFDGRGWYWRDTFLGLLAAGLCVMAWTNADPSLTHNLVLQIAVFCIGLFVACMFCHGELVTLKPAPRYLTRFYLMVSLGGAIGAVLVGVIAPLVLPADFELAGALVLCALLLLWQVRRAPPVFGALAFVAVLVTNGAGLWGIIEFYRGTVFVSRNFYGVLRVQDAGSNEFDRRLQLVHGSILHGKQYTSPTLRNQPTSYYTPDSGIGRLLESLHPRLSTVKVGVIGLGAGTLAAYGAKGDVYRFYEINPGVQRIAQLEFSYLKDSAAAIELPLGDARLKLEREPPQAFDVLAIDAFSSDAIPVHLITREAVEIYLKHLGPEGVIAFHVTNRYLDLVPIVEGIANALGLTALWIYDPGDDPLANASSWVLLARYPDRFDVDRLKNAATTIGARRDWSVWTDDFNNIVQALK